MGKFLLTLVGKNAAPTTLVSQAVIVIIQLTTMKQSLVTKKNRKVRLFEQHYPDIPIKLFYGKDYKALLAKFGIPAYDTVKLESFENDS